MFLPFLGVLFLLIIISVVILTMTYIDLHLKLLKYFQIVFVGTTVGLRGMVP